MKRILPLILLVYVVLLALFTTMVIVVHMIPRSAIEAQFKSSVKIFIEEGDYPIKGSLDGRVMLDNYTDCYMHNLAYCADASHPVDAAMRNYRYRDNEVMTVSMSHLASGDLINEPFEYGKYWHGYLVFLRPLLTVMDYGKIRILNGIVLSILLMVVLFLLTRRLSFGIALCFIVSLFMVHSAVVPWSLQYSTCYHITLVSMIAFLGFDWLSATRQRLVICFFIIGAITSFLDFFTTPVMTLGLPLTVLVLMDRKLCHLRLLFALCVAWLMGYSLMWASKWLMAYLLAGYNALEEATQSIMLQSVGQEENPIWYYWRELFDTFMTRWSIFTPQGLTRWGLVALLAIPALLAPKRRPMLKRYSVLLFIAMLSLLWYIVVARHSYTHFIISSRSLLVFWFSGLSFLYSIIDFKKLKSHVFRKK